MQNDSSTFGGVGCNKGRQNCDLEGDFFFDKLLAMEFLLIRISNIFILQIDVDECEELSLRFDISSMPTFVFLKNGKQVEKFSGANKQKLTETIETHAG